MDASTLDLMKLSAKNRILTYPRDMGCAPDVLLLVQEVEQLQRVLEERAQEVARLRAELRSKSEPRRFGLCEYPGCERATAAGARFCDIHLDEVVDRWTGRLYSGHSAPAVTHRRVSRSPRRGRTPRDEGGNGWDDAVNVLEGD